MGFSYEYPSGNIFPSFALQSTPMPCRSVPQIKLVLCQLLAYLHVHSRRLLHSKPGVAVPRSSDDVASINEVNQHRARLLLRW